MLRMSYTFPYGTARVRTATTGEADLQYEESYYSVREQQGSTFNIV